MCENCRLLDCEIDFMAKQQDKFQEQLEQEYIASLEE